MTLPPTDIFQMTPQESIPDSSAARKTAERVCIKMSSLGAPCSVEKVIVGPQVTRILLRPEPSTTMREFRRLDRADDIACEIAATRVRIEAPLPGPSLVSVEVPAPSRRTVRLGDIFDPAAEGLIVPLGLDVNGERLSFDLAAAPHTLIAGQTGAGKSIVLNTILSSLIARMSPADLALCLVDVKRVEMASYEGLPHLLCPVANDPQTAVSRLESVCEMMSSRYLLAERMGAKDLPNLNAKLRNAGHEPLPYVVVVIDEMADLMMTSRKQVESLIVRLAQKGRAAGIHLLLATQSPRVSVLSGLISANVPTRIALTVAKQIDSRVILDTEGAESLLGKGDGLLSLSGLPAQRFQGAMTTTEEVDAVCDFWRDQVTDPDTLEMETVAYG